VPINKSKNVTKSNLSYSSIHLLLPTPKVFQQFNNPVKYSCGINGFVGTTFLHIERINLRSIKYFGGGPIFSIGYYVKYLIIDVFYVL
jgi:hypothetical protein